MDNGLPSSILATALLGCLASAGLWDVYLSGQGRPQDTVSAIVQGWAKSFPILPLICGLILGHIFWPFR